MKSARILSALMCGFLSSALLAQETAASPSDDRPQRVSAGVSQGQIIKKVQPRYPKNARQAKVQGTVVLQALIDKHGKVKELTVVSGHPLLAPAAMKAVKKWKYKPYLLNNHPVLVETQIVVNFALSEN